MTKELEVVAAAYVAKFEAFVAERLARGEASLYRGYSFTLGAQYARVFSKDAGVRCFIDAQGVVYRAKSWKARGTRMGTVDDAKVFAFIAGPVMRSIKGES